MGLSPLRNRGLNWGYRLLVAGGVLVAAVITPLFALTPKAEAAAGINQQMNFQGRLYNTAGNVVPDGYYNLEFNIYQDGDGTATGDTGGTPAGTLKWTEDWLNANSQGVRVQNGFLSVQLGSINPFGSSIDWNQDTIWLSMNIAGTGPSCTPFSACSPDGEMLPMKRMSATAYALNAQNANTLNGKNAGDFVQNTTSASLQTNTSLAIQSAADGNETAYLAARTSQSAAVLSLKGGASQTGDFVKIVDSSNNPLFKIDSAGAVTATQDASFTAKLGVGNAVVAGDQLYVKAAAGNVGVQVDGNGTQDIASFRDGSTSVATIGNNGQTTFQNSVNSTNAFQVKTAAGGTNRNLLNADTTNERITIGAPSAGANAKLDVYAGSQTTLHAYQNGTNNIAEFAATSRGAGTVTTNGTTTLAGTGTNFTKTLKVGDTVLVNASPAELRTITAIASDTSLTVGVAFASSASSLTFNAGTGAGAGTVDTTAASNTIAGTGTSFTTTFKVGDTIGINGEGLHVISAIASDTSLTIADTATNTVAGKAYARNNYDPLVIKPTGILGVNTLSPQAALHVQSPGVGQVGMIVQGSNGQTADLFQVLDYAGGVLAKVNKDGDFTSRDISGRYITSSAKISAVTSTISESALTATQSAASATSPVFVVKGGATPTATADLIQMQDSGSNPIAGFSNGGQLYLGRSSNNNGSIKFFNSSGTGSITINSGNTTGDIALTLPTVLGSTGDCLKDSGSGALAFQTCSNGVTTIGTFDGTIAYDNGATISGTTLTFGAATAAKPGIVSTIAQTFGGDKTFAGNTTFNGTTTSQNTTNSTSAFSVKTATTGTNRNVLNVDTTNERVTVGAPTAAANAKLDVYAGSQTSLHVYQNGTNNVAEFSATSRGVGTVATNGTTTLTGTGTAFLTTLQVGSTILVNSGTAQLRTITAIASDTSLTVGVAFSGTASGLTFNVGGAAGAGSVATTASANTVTGTGTTFTTSFRVGDSIIINGDAVHIISAIASDTSLTLADNAVNTTSGATYARANFDPLTIKPTGALGVNTLSPQAALHVQSPGVGQVGMAIQAASGQTANLFNILAANGTVIASINKDGDFSGRYITSSAKVSANTSTASESALTAIQSAASATAPVFVVKNTGATPTATADLIQLQDSSSNPIAGFSKDGQLYLGRGSNNNGSMKIYNSTNNNAITIQSGVTTGSGYILTLPTSAGAATDCLQNDGTTAGTLAFGTCGVKTIDTLDHVTKSTSGAVITGTVLSLQSADNLNPGLVTSGASVQTMGINKTFQNADANGDSTTAITVKKTAANGGGTVFNVDTTNSIVDTNGTSRTTSGAAQTTDTGTFKSANTSGTQTNGVNIDRNGAGGTTTNGLNISNTAGTLTNGIAFNGTIGTDINHGAGTLTMNGNTGINFQTGGTATTAGTTVSSLSASGAALFQNSADSANAFQVQSSTGTRMLNIDTSTMQLQIGDSAPYVMRLPGASGAYASTPDSVANSVTGNLDLAIRVAMTDWTPTSSQDIITKNVTTGNQVSFRMYVSASGTPHLLWSADGSTTIDKGSTASVSATDGQTIWLRATLTVNNGGNNEVRFYTAPDASAIPSSWTQLGSTVTTAGATSIFNSTSPIEIGSRNNGTSGSLNGSVYRALMYNGIAGTLVNDFNPTRAASVASTTFTASTGETWTRNGTAVFLASTIANFSQSLSTIYTPTLIKNASDSAAAFQVQTSGGANVLNVDTLNNQVVLGNASSGTNAKLVFQNATNANTVTLVSGTTTAGAGSGYTLTLPTNVGTVGDCLQNDATTVGTLVFSTCGVKTIGTFSNTSIANGGSISGNTLTFGAADTTNPGMVSTTTQSFAGDKTFQTTTNSNTAHQVQNAAGTNVFAVGTISSTTNLITNGDFETNNAGWSAKSGGAVTQLTTAAGTYYGKGGGQLVFPATSGSGISTAVSLTLGNTYTLTFYARVPAAAASATNIQAGYTNTGGDQDCFSGNRTLVNGGWTRYSCTFTVTTTAGTAIYIRETTATSQTINIDSVLLLAGNGISSAYTSGTMQLGGTINAPVAIQNSTDSTTAFLVQNSAGTNDMLAVDTLNSTVNVGNTLKLLVNGVNRVQLANTGASVANGGCYNFSTNGSDASGPFDSSLCRDGVGTLGLRSTTTAQTLSIYNTYTDASNYERANIGFSSNVFNIDTQAAGTGTTRAINIGGTNATTVSVGGVAATTVNIGATSGTATVQLNLGTNNTSGSTTNVLIGSGSSATGGTTQIQSKANTTIATNGTTRATFDTSNGLYLGPGTASGAPGTFTLQATASSTTGVTGGTLQVQGGNATTGNADGGNLQLMGGSGAGTGVTGLVVLGTPTFNSVNDGTCYLVGSSCTISQSSVNSYSQIVIGFTVNGQTATLPDPSTNNRLAGRLIYITAANTSSDFTLLINTGGTGNLIAMRANTTATMIWSGSKWTAAGASSSTTLQAAYDNTLQSAGGAELIVSKTAATNGLTIRDSSANPVNGALVSIQSSSAATLFAVNSNLTEYASNPGAETAGASSTTFAAGNWSAAPLGGTVSRYVTAGANIASGTASVQVSTAATAGQGAKNTLSATLIPNNHYNVSFSARLASGTFTDMDVYYSIDGSANSVLCTSNQAIKTSINTKVNCSFTAPSSGMNSSNAIFIRQTTGVSRIFYIDNLSVTIAADYNLTTDSGVDDSVNFSTNYTSTGTGATVSSRITSDGNTASSSAEVAITTGGTDRGIKSKLSISPLPSTLYRVSVYARQTVGAAFTDFKARYTRDGGTNFADCVDYSTQTLTSSWAKITCYVTTDSTAATTPQLAFVAASSAARTFRVDDVSITLASPSTPNVQIGGGITGGPTTLFTLDKGASAPISGDNESLLGSMYYDTTLGKLQCYEADGWGACGSSPDNIVTISPEYTNAVMHGTGVGTMTSDICSSSLGINDGSGSPAQPTICGSNETYNFYKWTSPQASTQAYSIYVTYQLPTTFKSFASGQTSVAARVDSTSNASVQLQIYKNAGGSALTACGGNVTITSSPNTWQSPAASGLADPSTCSFTGGNSIVFKITMSAVSNANAYVGNLNFTFSNK